MRKVVLLAAWCMLLATTEVAWCQGQAEVTFYTYPAKCSLWLLPPGTSAQRLSLGTSGYPWTPSREPAVTIENGHAVPGPSPLQVLQRFLAGQKTLHVLIQHDGFADTTVEVPTTLFEPGVHRWPPTRIPAWNAAPTEAEARALDEDCEGDLRLVLSLVGNDEVLLDKFHREAWRDRALFRLIYQARFTAAELAAARVDGFNAEKRQLTVGGVARAIDDDSRAYLQASLQLGKMDVPYLFYLLKPCNAAVRDEALAALRSRGVSAQELMQLPNGQYHAGSFGQLEGKGAAAVDRWAALRGTGAGPFFCDIGRDGLLNQPSPVSLQDIMAAEREPFAVEGAQVRKLERNQQLIPHFVRPMSEADVVEALQRRWNRAVGMVRLPPYMHAVTFHSIPEGAAIHLRGSGDVGVTGQPVTLNFSNFLSGMMKEGAYQSQIDVSFSLSPGFDAQTASISVPWLATHDAWPQGAPITLTENVRGARLYYWAWRDHRTVTIVVLIGLLGVAWIVFWRLRTWRHEAFLARLREQDLAGATDPMVGHIFGRYMVCDRLGSGGMATVYKAFPIDVDYDKVKRDNDFWAIKVIHPDICSDPEFRGRFAREIRVCRGFDHPNIVRVKEDGEQEGQLYLVMELVEGTTLARKIPRMGMGAEEALRYLRPVFEGLNYAHSKEVVHRDIKPENLMVTEAGNMKIMDFGLARRQVTQKLTATGTVLGTPAYMPPEQIEGVLNLDPRADQYSLGVVVYEVLTGRTPFIDDDPLQVVMKQLTEEPPPMTLLRPDVGAEIDQVVRKMLAKKPQERYASLAEALQALEAAVARR